MFLGTPLPYLCCPVSPVTQKQGELTCDLLENPFPTLIAPQLPIDKKSVRILVLFYTVNFTTYSSKVDYTILTLVPRQDTTL